ncbi:Clp protease ClpP [Hymenobacter swuensis]|nr:ATP-dependent Clp protease proteolytic subunit [Hymenobacter swuensis]
MEREYRLFEQIEMWHAAHLDTFLSELEAAGVRTATIRINTPGGSWLAGQKMRTRLLNSKLTITCINEGLVGSAATLPYSAGKVRQCQPHAKFMMHQVSSAVEGQVKELKKAIAGQEALNRSTAEMYEAVSSKSADEWERMMEEETWLTAEQAKTIGFCTQCLPARAGMVAPDATMQVAELHTYYMSLIPNSAPEMKLDEVKNALRTAGVTLPENATEADALAAIAKLQNQVVAPEVTPKAEQGETELEKALKRIKQLEDDKVTGQTQRIEDVVNSAISSGRITAAQKDLYTSLAKSDYTNTAKLLGELPARVSVASRTNLAASAGGKASGADSRNDWDFEKWSKEDERGLLDIKRNDPDKYQNLLDGIL